MSQNTSIEWADSTLNLQMGCAGCELWNSNVRTCYAGQLTNRYAGAKGYPMSFDKPQLFLDRLDKALRWKDLRGKERPEKPWLNGRPRVIFLNDMGDTFTEGLPIDWLAPLLPRVAESPHLWLILTKRARRMVAFSEQHPLPANVWPGVSVTNIPSAARIHDLLKVKGGGLKWISAEPLFHCLDLRVLPYSDGSGTVNSLTGHVTAKCREVNSVNEFYVRTAEPVLSTLKWVVVGGESGQNARKCLIDDMLEVVRSCQGLDVPVFVKQLGTYAQADNYDLQLEDPKGGNPCEWPPELQVREFPEV